MLALGRAGSLRGPCTQPATSMAKAPPTRADFIASLSRRPIGQCKFVPAHRLVEAARSHVGPPLCDPCQTLGLRPDLAGIAPTRGVLAIDGPDRMLALLVDDDLERALGPVGHAPSYHSTLATVA